MKFIVELGNVKVLMNAEQVKVLANLLYGSEQITNKYIGGSGGAKSHYLKIIDTFSVQDTFKFGAMADEEYDAMVLVTKIHNESNP